MADDLDLSALRAEAQASIDGYVADPRHAMQTMYHASTVLALLSRVEEAEAERDREEVRAANWSEDAFVLERERDEANAALTALRDGVQNAIDRANAMKPDDFKTGQEHLAPAFRQIDFRAAFEALAGVVNEIETLLHATEGTDDEGGE